MARHFQLNSSEAAVPDPFGSIWVCSLRQLFRTGLGFVCLNDYSLARQLGRESLCSSVGVLSTAYPCILGEDDRTCFALPNVRLGGD